MFLDRVTGGMDGGGGGWVIVEIKIWRDKEKEGRHHSDATTLVSVANLALVTT